MKKTKELMKKTKELMKKTKVYKELRKLNEQLSFLDEKEYVDKDTEENNLGDYDLSQYEDD